MTLPHPIKKHAAGALYDEIAASHPSLLAGRVHCGKCGTTRTVDPARCLREGWPKCECGGGTMGIDKPKDGCGNG